MWLWFKICKFQTQLGDWELVQENITLEWMPADPIDGKSTLVQVTAWWPQVFGAIRQQAIAGTSVDQDTWCHVASLSHSELKKSMNMDK